MNARGAGVVEGDLAQPALSKLSWKNYWSFLRKGLDINSPPIEPRTVDNSEAIILRVHPSEESNFAWMELIFFGQLDSRSGGYAV